MKQEVLMKVRETGPGPIGWRAKGIHTSPQSEERARVRGPATPLIAGRSRCSLQKRWWEGRSRWGRLSRVSCGSWKSGVTGTIPVAKVPGD